MVISIGLNVSLAISGFGEASNDGSKLVSQILKL